jgi:hypothetical protein
MAQGPRSERESDEGSRPGTDATEQNSRSCGTRVLGVKETCVPGKHGSDHGANPKADERTDP